MAIANIVCTLSPRRIILGGSIRKAGHYTESAFFHVLREHVKGVLAGNFVAPALQMEINNLIVPPLLGDDAGVLGAIALGLESVARHSSLQIS
ncbi:hypothetical protein BH11PLA2_BH11PLA2_46510 [soil metagenome]